MNQFEYRDWRRQVLDRDSHTCRKCDRHNVGLIAHHIEGYNNNPDLRTKVSNGTTLCEACHNNFHHQYGYGNNTRIQLEEFMGVN